MAIKEVKEKLHHLIDQTTNEVLLEDMLLEAESRINATLPHEIEGLSKEDYKELKSLLKEKPEADALSFEELKSSLNRWFTK